MMQTARIQVNRNERGVALVLTMFLTLVMSIVAASLMFLSQTETYSTLNYRTMSQARYGAEAGIQQAANYLMYAYAPPLSTGSDLITNYDTSVSPVTYAGSPVILSANSSVASNYPYAAAKTAFAALQGTLTLGTTNATNVQYAPYATLISMENVSAANSVDGVEHTIQTWQITSDGNITIGTRTAQVEVGATLDTQKISTSSPSLNYATFATAATCGAVTFSGGAHTASYNSAAAGFNPSTAPSAANGDLQTSCTASGHDQYCNTGSVGTNGNLTDSGGATINGTLSTPRVGVGNCSSGNVDANSSSGGASITGGLVQLPSAVTLATPNIPAPSLGSPLSSNTTIGGSTTCANLVSAGVPSGNCSGTAGNLTITGPLTLGNISVTNANVTIVGNDTLGNVSVSSSGSLTLNPGTNTTMNMTSLSTSGGGSASLGAGTINSDTVSMSGGTTASIQSAGQVTLNVIDSFTMSGGSTLSIPADTGVSTPAAVYLNVVNTSGVNKPVDFSGGTVSNNSYDASRFQIQYGGTGEIDLSGGTKQAETIYAPNAAAKFSGGSALYGEVVAATITDSGGATIYYDRNLMTKGLFAQVKYQPGNPMLSAFSWKRF